MRPINILIVEDTPDHAEGFIAILEGAGYRIVAHTQIGSAALGIVESKRPDCVLMDIELEDGKRAGLNAARLIRSRLDTPIVFITGTNLTQIEKRSLRLMKPLWYLIKPVTSRQLLHTVEFATSGTGTTRVFICYSRKDKRHLDRLRAHLKSLEPSLIETWADNQIDAGTDWLSEILKALESTDVAILLLSASFQDSRFIELVEKPGLLKRLQEHGTQIVPVVVEHVALLPELSALQLFNSGQVVGALPVPKQQKVWAELINYLKQRLAP
jgi:CheY-like chemotaxis protein